MRERLVDGRGVAPAQAVAVEAAPQPKLAVGRLGFVDSLRALAALYVVVSHTGQEVWPQHAPDALVGSLVYGRLAVSMFIVLSGFSLMLPVARHGYRLPWSVGRFYWRRAKRILPPYYCAMALSLALIWLLIGQATGSHWDIALPVTRSAIIEHLALVQNFTHTNYATINYVFWSIAMECQIYLVFPGLILLWRRYPPLVAALMVVALSLILLFALVPTWIGHLPDYAGTEFVPQFFGLFALGMFAASIYATQTPRWNRLRDRYFWEVVVLVCFGLVALKIAAWPLWRLDLAMGVGTVGLLLAAARPAMRNPVRAALEWRPLVWIGGFSYSVYLIHAPLIQLLWQYGLRPLGFGLNALPTYLALLLVGLPLIVAASWLFWWGCERPFLNSKPLGWRGAAPVSS